MKINRNTAVTAGLICLLFMASTPIKNTAVKFSIPFSGKFFTTDNLGNLFCVHGDNSIVKYNKDGVIKANVNFKIYGQISQLDVSNPFEIYAYYRDQQTLIILDNLLSVRATINLNDLSTGEITAACRAFDNGFWFFDAGNMRLFKCDKSKVKKQESLPLASWTSERWTPHQMLDNEKNLFVNDSINGIAVFDVFANYYKTIPVKGLKDFQIKKNTLYFFQENYLQGFDIQWRTSDSIIYAPEAKMIRLDADHLYEWSRDSIFVRHFPQ